MGVGIRPSWACPGRRLSGSKEVDLPPLEGLRTRRPPQAAISEPGEPTELHNAV